MLLEDEDLRKKINEKRVQMRAGKNKGKSPANDTDLSKTTSSSEGKSDNLIVVTSPSDTTIYTQAIKQKVKPAASAKNSCSLGTMVEQGESDGSGDLSVSSYSNFTSSISDSSTSSDTESDSSLDDERQQRRAKRRRRKKCRRRRRHQEKRRKEREERE